MNGFAEFVVVKTGNTWINVIPKDRKTYETKKKFVLYTGTETIEHKEVIRNVYNGTWQFQDGKLNKNVERNNNMYGEVIKLFIITSSGSEGINLKNTRFVHIAEPFWHMVRLQQVIGRARRICSHAELPIEHQTVKVFLYVSTFSKLQIDESKYLDLFNSPFNRSKISTETPYSVDQLLLESSEKKNVLNQKFLEQIKMSAIDCRLFSKEKGSSYCYSVGHITSNDFISVPDINVDMLNKYSNNKEIRHQFRDITIPIDNKKVTFKYSKNLLYNIDNVEKAIEDNDLSILKPIGKLIKNDAKIEIEWIK
jgi:archaellin